MKKEEGRLTGYCEDILEIARLISASANPDEVITNSLDHLTQRLGKRARCAMLGGDELVLRYWSGEYEHPLEGTLISRESVVWSVFRGGIPANLTDERQSNGYGHTLKRAIKVKAVIPFGYVDPLTRETRKIGVLVVDSGQDGVPISAQDFEYLKVIGHLVGSVLGKAELLDQFTGSCLRQKEIIGETAHNFRNRMVVIGGLCRRILRLNADKNLARDVSLLFDEVQALEAHVKSFEEYMRGTEG